MKTFKSCWGNGTEFGDYKLPSPPTDVDLQNAIQKSLKFLSLGPLEITAPILVAAYRAPLGAIISDDSVLLTGRTGAFKSELAAVVLGHFGNGFTGRNLPGNWASTADSLERQAFLLKDTLFAVDDFSPTGWPARRKGAAWQSRETFKRCD